MINRDDIPEALWVFSKCKSPKGAMKLSEILCEVMKIDNIEETLIQMVFDNHKKDSADYKIFEYILKQYEQPTK